MRPSRLITGTPKYNPVAATTWPGKSGTWSRDTARMASTNRGGQGRFFENKIRRLQGRRGVIELTYY
jgi:hypothetical protein